MGRFEHLAELVAYVECRTTDVVDRDGVLGALGARASVDVMAARTLLQLLLPGAKALVARYRWSAESVDELAATVVADLYDRIRALSAGVRRRCLAPAVLLDVGKRLQRRAARARRHDQIRLEEMDPDTARTYEHEDAALELDQLLRWATERRYLSCSEAELIRLTRVADIPVAVLSARSGEQPQTIRRRRLRAERALAAAARAA
ncbi:MAG: hypothetical protein ACLGI2_14360 [Acidimicrobiia bacterium]